MISLEYKNGNQNNKILGRITMLKLAKKPQAFLEQRQHINMSNHLQCSIKAHQTQKQQNITSLSIVGKKKLFLFFFFLDNIMFRPLPISLESGPSLTHALGNNFYLAKINPNRFCVPCGLQFYMKPPNEQRIPIAWHEIQQLVLLYISTKQNKISQLEAHKTWTVFYILEPSG